MRNAKYTKKYVLTCPYCGFEQPEHTDNMPEQEDIISFKDGIFVCSSCGSDFIVFKQ